MAAPGRAAGCGCRFGLLHVRAQEGNVSDHNYKTCPCHDCGYERLQDRLGRRRVYATVSQEDLCRALKGVLRGLPPGAEIKSVFPFFEFDRNALHIQIESPSFPIVKRDASWKDMEVKVVLVENGNALRVLDLPKRQEGDEGAFI
jgi:uncharacterized Fe-S cluster-containing protein